jgi:hypothetical protein
MNTNPATNQPPLDRAAAAFGLAAAIAILFNTVLAWVKDVYDPLNRFMASLTGHHWTTHGLADLVVFAALGVIFLNTGVVDRISPNRLVALLVGAVILAVVGLAAWFVLV